MNLLSHFRDGWPDSMTERPPVSSLRHTDEDDEGDDSDEVEGLEGDEDHVYQSLERQSRADDINVVYAVPIKHRKVQSCVCVCLFGSECGLLSTLMHLIHLLKFTMRWSYRFIQILL